MSTIRDVAKIADVSTATVSRVINSPEKVSSKTRDRVCQAMEICRYQYNALARGFVTKRSRSIGLVIPTITNPIFAESTRGVQDFAEGYGYQVILGNTDYQYDKEMKLIEVLRERQVEGMIITTNNLKGQVLQKLLADRFPFVLLYSTVRKGPVSAVGVDNFSGGYRATEHLIEQNHRRIGMLAGGFGFSDRSFHRWHGYKKCLKDHNIPYDPELVVQSRYTLIDGKNGVKKICTLADPPTAVFCSNDFLALGAMEGAKQLGLALPEDLSIVGFDGIEIGSFMAPPLTTIYQPAYDMGRTGAEVLLHQVEMKTCEPVHKMLETRLLVRGSTAVAPGRRKVDKPLKASYGL